MSDTASDYQTLEPASTEGLDDLFSKGLPAGVPEGVPVETAAIALGLTDRAVLKRLRRGTLKGFKVPSKFGEKWLVSIEGLPGLPLVGLPLVSQEVTKSEIEEVPSVEVGLPFLELVPPSKLLGVPPSNNLAIDQLIDIVTDLQSKLDKTNEQLQGATYRNGYLESKLEEREKQILLLTDSQHKPGWWAKFSSWFFKGQ